MLSATRLVRTVLVALFFWFLWIPSLLRAAPPTDADQDGLADEFEQQLLTRFVPLFLISGDECDAMPAEFGPGSSTPRLVARNGTIYGQVFPVGTRAIEIHYYHLWSRDCGRVPHAFDVEHVSALVRADSLRQSAGRWRAAYWFAAAHQNTLCDASEAAHADAVEAVDRGPRIWVSRGKHASFLSLAACGQGCGSDRCERVSPLPVGKLINLGEPGGPLNGTAWAQSPAWPLAAKMKPDFSSALLAQLAQTNGTIAANTSLRPVRAVIAAGGTSMEAMTVGHRHTEEALSNAGFATEGALATAVTATEEALAKSTVSVRNSLRRTRRAVDGWFRRHVP